MSESSSATSFGGNWCSFLGSPEGPEGLWSSLSRLRGTCQYSENVSITKCLITGRRIVT